jgi:hypothetical protein
VAGDDHEGLAKMLRENAAQFYEFNLELSLRQRQSCGASTTITPDGMS